MSAERVLIDPPASSSRRELPSAATATITLGRVSLYSGMGLLVVFGLNLVLVLWEPQPGNPRWEMGVLSLVIDQLPMLVIALVMVTGGVLLRGGRASIVLTATCAAGIALVLVAAMLLYALGALQLLQEAQNVSLLRRTIAVTLSLALLYTAVFIMISLSLARHARVRSQSRMR